MVNHSNVVVLKETAETIESGLNTGYELCWESLSYRVKVKDQEKVILNNLSGSLKPGSVLAVIGASGAGKSSFLDCLSGRNPSVTGKVLIDGNENVSLKHISRYCSQEEALFGSLTVKETLTFAAQFNLPESTPKAQLDEIVDDLIAEFGLIDVKNTIIGTPLIKGCSGGQIRRVSVASQLVGLKSGLLFLDEPTSGLDSVAAASVIESVKKLADRYNSTIIATIHQPSTTTFNLFTHVLIMAKGSTIYFGERQGALAYFERIGRPIPLHFNPSDVYLQMTNTDFLQDKEKGSQDVSKLIESFKESPEQAAITKSIENSIFKKTEMNDLGYSNGFYHQTKVLMNRAFLNAAKNPLSYWVRVAMYMVGS
jgi:ABC-type multidrug transport system ATPase subunit